MSAIISQLRRCTAGFSKLHTQLLAEAVEQRRTDLVEPDPCGVILELAAFFSDQRSARYVFDVKARPLGEISQAVFPEHMNVLARNAAPVSELFRELLFAKLGYKSRSGRNANQEHTAGFQDPIDLTHRELGSRQMLKDVRTDSNIRSLVRQRKSFVEIGLQTLIIPRKLDVGTIDVDVEADPPGACDRRNKALDDSAIAPYIHYCRWMIETLYLFVDGTAQPPVAKCPYGITTTVQLGGEWKIRPVRFFIFIDVVERLADETKSTVFLCGAFFHRF